MRAQQGLPAWRRAPPPPPCAPGTCPPASAHRSTPSKFMQPPIFVMQDVWRQAERPRLRPPPRTCLPASARCLTPCFMQTSLTASLKRAPPPPPRAPGACLPASATCCRLLSCVAFPTTFAVSTVPASLVALRAKHMFLSLLARECTTRACMHLHGNNLIYAVSVAPAPPPLPHEPHS